MKSILNMTWVGLAALMMGLGAARAETAPTVEYTPVAGQSSVKIEGGSTLHDWSATTSDVQGHIRLPGRWTDDGLLEAELTPGPDAAPEIVVRIPAETLKSGTGGLDERMYEALETNRHRVIHYRLDEVLSADANRWRTRGRLTVAGNTQTIDLDLGIQPSANGTIVVTTETSVRMTHFGIDPPRAMLGAVRAHDPVRISARWTVQRQTPQPTAPRFAAPDEHRKAVSELVNAYSAVHLALSAEQLEGATRALSAFEAALTRARELDVSGLEAEARASWEQSLSRIAGAAGSAQRARSIGAARASFVIVSQGLASLIESVGHDHESSIIAFRRTGQSGMAGATWLLPGNAQAIRTPYETAQPGRTEVEMTALYLATPRLAAAD